MMKRVLAVSILLSPVHAGGGGETLPPEDLRAEWSELEDFEDWKIAKFKGWGIPFDGGSKVFSFQTESGDHFEVMAANPAYWSAREIRGRMQVFFVICRNRFYRIESGSEREKDLIRMIEAARPRLSGEGRADPKFMDGLAKRIRDRKPMFETEGDRAAAGDKVSD